MAPPLNDSSLQFPRQQKGAKSPYTLNKPAASSDFASYCILVRAAPQDGHIGILLSMCPCQFGSSAYSLGSWRFFRFRRKVCRRLRHVSRWKSWAARRANESSLDSTFMHLLTNTVAKSSPDPEEICTFVSNWQARYKKQFDKLIAHRDAVFLAVHSVLADPTEKYDEIGSQKKILATGMCWLRRMRSSRIGCSWGMSAAVV